MNDQTEQKQAWDNLYQKPGRTWAGQPSYIPFPGEHSHVLELGCGEGRTTAALAARGGEILAIDRSANACRNTRNSSVKFGGIGVITADAQSIPVRAGSMDAVAANHVLGHCFHEGRTACVQEILRVLKTKGYLSFCDFSVMDFRSGRGTCVEPGTYRRGTGIITHYFTNDEVTDLFSCFHLMEMKTNCWQIRIRGKDYPRCEITALLRKT